MKKGRVFRYGTDALWDAGGLYYMSWLIRNGETATAIDRKENGVHCDPIEESVKRLDKQDLWDRQVSFVITTQMVMLTRTKNVAERTARIILFFPQNAYVRHIRMTEGEYE